MNNGKMLHTAARSRVHACCRVCYPNQGPWRRLVKRSQRRVEKRQWKKEEW